MVKKVLKILLEKFDVVIVAIEELRVFSQLLIEELMGSLLTHERGFKKSIGSLKNAFQY